MNSDRDIRSASIFKRSLDVKGCLKPCIEIPKNYTNLHNSSFAWINSSSVLCSIGIGPQIHGCWRFVNFESTKCKSHMHMHSQSIPEGSPSLMAVDFSKLDLPKLAADAAKYPNAGVPIERMEFWRNLERSLHGRCWMVIVRRDGFHLSMGWRLRRSPLQKTQPHQPYPSKLCMPE